MNQIDIAILVIAGIGAIHGIFKGFILSITSLLGLILGYYLSIRFAWYFEAILRETTGSNSPFMHVIAFALCYLLVIIIVYIIGKSVQKTLELAALGCFNRMAGAIFGALKGLLFVSALIYIIEIADHQNQLIKAEKKNTSLLYAPIAKLIPSIMPEVKKGLERINGDVKRREIKKE